MVISLDLVGDSTTHLLHLEWKSPTRKIVFPEMGERTQTMHDRNQHSCYLTGCIYLEIHSYQCNIPAGEEEYPLSGPNIQPLVRVAKKSTSRLA